MDSYLSPRAVQRFELEIKRSRFLTTIAPTEDKQDARHQIQLVRDLFPDANHHCWAMIAGQPDDVYQQDQSDDGEPKGTAGKPMLNVLLHSGLGNTVAVVTRYFGGVKLGSGGLVRAYSQSVSQAVQQLDTVTQYVRSSLSVRLPYTTLATLEHKLSNTNTNVGKREFSDEVELELQVPASERDFVNALLTELNIRVLSTDTNTNTDT